MGSWTVTINGHGIHDNNLEGDIDRMVMDFVARLRTAGHTVDAAHLTTGAGRAVDINPVAQTEAQQLTYRTF